MSELMLEKLNEAERVCVDPYCPNNRTMPFDMLRGC
jgi:hypothetical protein